MKEVISIVNRKGGVGKTATAHAIGAGLARKGYRVLLVDLDSQCSLTSDVGAITAGLSSMDLLTGNATAEEVIQHSDSGDIIPASESLAQADITITTTGKEYRLKEALDGIAGEYDYCIIDTPPALNILTINALTASNSIIVPAEAGKHSIEGIAQLYKTVQAVQRYTNPELRIRGILITRYRGRAILSKDMKDNLESIASQLDTVVYSTPIRECIAVGEAQASGEDIYRYSSRSNASKDYKALVEEILRK